MHYVIIGNSSFSFEVAQGIRHVDQASEVSLFCPEGVLPYYRHALPSLILGMADDQMVCAPNDIYAQQHINLVMDKKIIRVQPKRKRLLTEDKEQIPFDVLIIEGIGPFVLPDFKGVQKQGVFHLKTFEDTKKMVDCVGLTDTAIVEVHSFLGLQVACHLRKIEQEVIAVVPGNHLFADLLDKDVADYIVEQCQKKGLRFVFNNAITEVLGDAEAKAIRLKTGKVLESEIVVFGHADRQQNLFNTEELFHQENDYYTQYEDVYCAKDLVHFLDRTFWEESFISQYAAAGHAACLVAGLTKQPLLTIPAPAVRSVQVDDLLISLLGSCKKDDNRVAYMKADYKVNLYKKILTEENVVKGAVLINDQASEAAVANLVREAAAISSVSGAIVDYQG